MSKYVEKLSTGFEFLMFSSLGMLSAPFSKRTEAATRLFKKTSTKDFMFSCCVENSFVCLSWLDLSKRGGNTS